MESPLIKQLDYSPTCQELFAPLLFLCVNAGYTKHDAISNNSRRNKIQQITRAGVQSSD